MSAIPSVNAVGLFYRPPVELLASLFVSASPLLCFIPLSPSAPLPRIEHIVDIYNHLPNGQLAILPNATHMVPFDDPATFNAVVDRFFRAPFVKKDRIQDTMKSLERMRSAPKH